MSLTDHIIESGYAMTDRERDIAEEFFNRGRRDASGLLTMTVARLCEVMRDDDGQAYKEARKFLDLHFPTP